MTPSQLVIVLITLTTAISAFVLPFTYNFIKNIFAEGYEEFDGIIELLKRMEKDRESQKKSKKIKDLKEEIKCTKGKLDDFNDRLRKLIYLLFGMWMFSVIFGGWTLLNESPDCMNYVRWVVRGILTAEIIILFAYIRVFIRCKPLKRINDLRSKKIQISSELEKINHNFTRIFAEPNTKKKNDWDP